MACHHCPERPGEWWQSGRVAEWQSWCLSGYDMNMYIYIYNIYIYIYIYFLKKIMFGMYNHICTYYLSRTMGDGSLSHLYTYEVSFMDDMSYDMSLSEIL